MELDDIWNDYRARLTAFLRARVSNPADVEDLLQEISVKLVAGLPSLKDQSRLQPWLFRTARNAIIDFYRRRGRERAVHPDDLWYADDEADTRRELEGCVAPFLRALPEDTARMLTAIDAEGMSQRDFADSIGVPYSTLKSRVRKGRAELRALFESCCAMSRDGRGRVIDYDAKSGCCENC